MVSELVFLIENSEDFETLTARLVEEGYIHKVYLNRKRFVNLVKQIYGNYIYKPDSSHYLSPLPGRIVYKTGVKYFIHGIVHKTLGYSLSEEYKESVREATKGWNLLCEDGFKDDFFLNVDIFGEVEALGINRPRNVVATLPKLTTQLFLVAYNKSRGISPQINLKNIKTIDDLRKVRLELFREYLPEPLGMGAILHINPNSLRIKRYVFEAEEAIRYSIEKELDELHLIVGCAHEMPLEYFLSNPDLIKNFKRD